MSYENCPFDDVNIVMAKGQPGDMVRASDTEFQQLVIDYILDNPDVLNSPALRTAISNYVQRTQTVYDNYDLGQTYAICESISQHEGDNVAMLPESIRYGFVPKVSGILAIKFPDGIPAGYLKIYIQGTYYSVVQTNHDGGPYEFKGFEVSPGDIVTFMYYYATNNRYQFLILGTSRPAPAIMPDGRIFNRHLPGPESLFMTTSGEFDGDSNTQGETFFINLNGLGPEGVRSYPLFMDVQITSLTVLPPAISRDVVISGSGITGRSPGNNGRGEFTGRVVINNNATSAIHLTGTWTVLWYIYG